MPLVVMDLAKFDTFDHNVVLKVLSTNFGVKDTAYNQFYSYLTFRKMHTQVNSSMSTRKNVTFSVPQVQLAMCFITADANTLPAFIVNVNQLAGMQMTMVCIVHSKLMWM